MANDSHQELVDFFDRFVDAFRTFDGGVVATRFHSPFIAVHTDKTVETLYSETETATYFQKYLEDYSALDCRTCGYRDLEVHPVGDSCLLATVTWELYDENRSILTSWIESYLIARKDSDLTILSTIDHAT